MTKAWDRPLLLALLRKSATVASILLPFKRKRDALFKLPTIDNFFSSIHQITSSSVFPTHVKNILNYNRTIRDVAWSFRLCPTNHLSMHRRRLHLPLRPRPSPPLPRVPLLHVRHNRPRSVGRDTRGHCTRFLARRLFEYSGHDAFCSYIGLCCCAGHGRFGVGRWVAGIDALGH